MFNAALGLFESALRLWTSKEKRKYLDKVIKIKRKWYAEYNKENPDYAVMDNLELELYILGESFNSQIRAEISED